MRLCPKLLEKKEPPGAAVGLLGKIIRSQISNAGIAESLYVTYVVKEKPPANNLNFFIDPH